MREKEYRKLVRLARKDGGVYYMVYLPKSVGKKWWESGAKTLKLSFDGAQLIIEPVLDWDVGDAYALVSLQRRASLVGNDESYSCTIPVDLVREIEKLYGPIRYVLVKEVDGKLVVRPVRERQQQAAEEQALPHT